MIAAHTAEQLADYQREVRSKRRKAPRVRNLNAIHALVETRSLVIGRRFYRVPPIGYRAGATLDALRFELERLSDDDVPEAERSALLTAGLDRAVEIIKPLLIPTSGADRWLWRLFRVRRNPLRDATEREIGQVLAFLAVCRTSGPSRVRTPTPTPIRR